MSFFIIIVFLISESFEDCLRTAISIGGDTDTCRIYGRRRRSILADGSFYDDHYDDHNHDNDRY